MKHFLTSLATHSSCLQGFLSILSDFTGSLCSGSALLVVANTLHGYHESFKAESLISKKGSLQISCRDFVDAIRYDLPSLYSSTLSTSSYPLSGNQATANDRANKRKKY